MNVFEAEIAKYERRLAKIEQSPRPNMVKSNKIFYQAMLEDNREQLAWWRQGKPFVVVGGSDLSILMRCFGDFRVLNLVRIADRMGTKKAEAAVEKLRAMGLPDFVCDRTILFLPLAAMAGEIPEPKIVVTRTGGCEVVNNTTRTLAKTMGIPLFTIDVPFEDPHHQHLPYVTKQMENLIAWVEANLPGAKFDEKKLVEWQTAVRRYWAALHDIYELRKHVPCPDHPRDVFREPMFPGQFPNPSLIIEYYERYRDELRERVAKNYSPVGEEKLRIVWAISGPYGSGMWDYLAQTGVAMPYFLFGSSRDNFVMPHYGDTSDYGRELKPLEEEARKTLYNSWGGGGERWIRDSVFACQEFKADGLVLFEQTGCQPVLGLGQLLTQRLKERYPIPVWSVEGRQLLGRSEGVEAEFMSGLAAFVNLCHERKKVRQAA
ncbi:MAG: 2-hydroxyacyl-CoA dehydratase [Chloroflexi bacterium]|nr:2-hydroxyacyl-CoA dehydratase [Chloroflexota bacterium]